MDTAMFTFFLIASAVAIDLRLYHRISHDTLFMGAHDHPTNSSKKVHAYAFLHIDHKSQLAVAHRSMPPPISKQVHFQQAANPLGCVVPIADGAEWKTVPSYVLNTRNSQQLTALFMQRAVQNGFQRWSCALGDRMVVGPLSRIRTDRSGDSINIDVYDGINEIGIGRIVGRPGTIAMTVLFGTFGGPIAERELIAFKMIFDESNNRFGNATERPNVVDFESIATHECGHVFGLDDVYDAACEDVTMFGTTAAGERKKQTLENSDIEAVRDLYE
jgi:hypothetical protein